jgi:serine/threonine protein kinase
LTGQRVAVKIFKRQDIWSTLDLEDAVQSEIDIHSRLNHPLIPMYIGPIQTKDVSALVMEYVEGPTLLDHVMQHGPLSEAEARGVFAQIVSVVDYMHSKKGFVHGDLKLENILITERQTIKVIDFGFAHENSHPVCTQAASRPYAAPEIIKCIPYKETIDIWSMGVMLYASLCGFFPFGCDDVNELMVNVLCYDPEYPEELSDEVVDLLEAMLRKDPRERATIEDVKTHVWLRDVFLQVQGLLAARPWPRAQSCSDPEFNPDNFIIPGLELNRRENGSGNVRPSHKSATPASNEWSTMVQVCNF